jgi:hypothetical protein
VRLGDDPQDPDGERSTFSEKGADMNMKKTMAIFATTALVAASAAWAADNTVTQGGTTAPSTDRGAHDVKKEH